MTTVRAPRHIASPGMLAPLLLLAAGLLCAGPADAQSASCDQFKETLAGRIRVPGFTLESVPASTKTPAGAKVVGTCEGGAYKVLLRRGAAAEEASASAPDEAAAAAAAPPPRPTPAATPTPAPSPTATPTPAATPAPTPTPAPAATPPPEPPAAVAQTVADGMSWTDLVLEFLARYWPWVLTLAGLPLLIWLAAWITHRRYYDEAGLPRGPRLN
jgi:outer membrane biosynthesis protein TonB